METSAYAHVRIPHDLLQDVQSVFPTRRAAASLNKTLVDEIRAYKGTSIMSMQDEQKSTQAMVDCKRVGHTLSTARVADLRGA